MTPQQVIAALQALHAEIEGVASAPTDYPGSLNATELPCALVVPGEGTHAGGRVGATRTTREYRVHVFCMPVAQGRDGLGIQRVVELLPRFAAAYFTARVITFGGDSAFLDFPFRDTGHAVIEYASMFYHGFTFTLTISEVF